MSENEKAYRAHTVTRPTRLSVPNFDCVETGKLLDVTHRLLEVIQVGCGRVVDVLALPVPERVD